MIARREPEALLFHTEMAEHTALSGEEVEHPELALLFGRRELKTDRWARVAMRQELTRDVLLEGCRIERRLDDSGRGRSRSLNERASGMHAERHRVMVGMAAPRRRE